MGDDGREDGRQGHDMGTLGHSQSKQLRPTTSDQFYLGVGREELEGTDRASPVHRQEQKTGRTLTNVVRVQKDWHRRWSCQLE